MVDRFVRRSALRAGKSSFLTLSDLLKAHDMEDLFARSFAIVAERATVADADLALRLFRQCEDVFVTQGGTPDEKVTGWLTDWDIDKALAT
jgi:hypothetical protein